MTSEDLLDAALDGDDGIVREALRQTPNLARESIHVAAAVADADAAAALLLAEPSRANLRGGRRDWPPLLYLCCSRVGRADATSVANRVRIAGALVAQGADVNANGFEAGYTSPNVTQMFDDHEWRAIEGAAGRVASPELVQLLLDAGADLSQTQQALSRAVQGGDGRVLQALLAAAPHPWWQVRWALKACVVLDRLDMVRPILDATRGDSPTQVGSDRALFEAIRLKRGLEWIELLLGDDSTPESTMPTRRAAYRLAQHYGHRAAADVLRRRGVADAVESTSYSRIAERVIAAASDDDGEVGLTPDTAAALFERAADAVVAGDLDTLRQLLDEHPHLARARSPRPHRATLLIYCGANGVEEFRQRTPPNAAAIAELLLTRGADANAACRLYGGGSTTMGLLTTSIHPREAGVDGDLIRVLARFGVALSPRDLDHAIDSGAARAAAAIAAAGVPIETLFAAAGLDRLDVMADLVSRGADVNARWTPWSSTALHAAAAMDRAAAARFLLEHGADRSLENIWGATPAGAARYFGHAGIAALIDTFPA